jgi:hypothetical protein
VLYGGSRVPLTLKTGFSVNPADGLGTLGLGISPWTVSDKKAKVRHVERPLRIVSEGRNGGIAYSEPLCFL